METIEKIQRLEKYLQKNNNTDDVFAEVIRKIYSREIRRIKIGIKRLQNQIITFENQYNLSSDAFLIQYEDGKLGDDIDFIEWAATIEMLENATGNLKILTE